MLLEIVLGIILSLTHFFGEKILAKFKHHNQSKVISFGAGISITYLFLQLFPELYSEVIYTNKLVFVYVLIGFTLLHLREKYIYQHVQKRRLLFELKEAHSVAFFVYHFILGIVIVKIIQSNLLEGLLFFVPIFFHAAISNVAMSEIHHHIKGRFDMKILLSLAPIAGVLLGLMFVISNLFYAILLGFVAGALLYVIVRDVLPKDRKGSIEYFVVGTAVYTLLIMLTWML
jgi:zinc transporter ZupT